MCNVSLKEKIILYRLLIIKMEKYEKSKSILDDIILSTIVLITAYTISLFLEALQSHHKH